MFHQLKYEKKRLKKKNKLLSWIEFFKNFEVQ